MGFFNNIVSTAISVGESIFGITKSVYNEFKSKVEKFIDSHLLEKREKTNYSDVEDINSEIYELKQKSIQDGLLNGYDRNRLRTLREKRDRFRKKVDQNKEIDLANNIAKENNNFGSLEINNLNLHILENHIGYNPLGKICISCEKPMKLQWSPKKEIREVYDYWWGCCGWYETKCNYIEKFTEHDLSILINLDNEVSQVSNEDLNMITELHADHLKKRMNKIKNDKIDEYLCPIHHTPMILRQKKGEFSGLLNMYFLACKRYFDENCPQIEKIKSPAQLSALLKAKTNVGIIS